MGISIFSKSSGCGNVFCNTNEPVRGNPSPTNFRIIESREVGRFLIAKVRYPDADNYEGQKVLVFEGLKDWQLRRLNSLDPHFCESNAHFSPIARFVPTTKGWNMALRMCRGENSRRPVKKKVVKKKVVRKKVNRRS